MGPPQTPPGAIQAQPTLMLNLACMLTYTLVLTLILTFTALTLTYLNYFDFYRRDPYHFFEAHKRTICERSQWDQPSRHDQHVHPHKCSAAEPQHGACLPR